MEPQLSEPRITITLNLGDPASARGLANLLAALEHGAEPRHEVAGTKANGNGNVNGSQLPAPSRRTTIKPVANWDEFETTLTDRTRQFIARLRKDGRLTLPQVLNMFGRADTMNDRKAIGGMIGAMSRKADNRGIALPFRQSENQLGERMWAWTGPTAQQSAQAN